MQPLGPIHYPFSYHLTSWFIVRSAPPVTLHLLGFPLRALKQMFFPQHLRQCYLIRSYQIRMPRGIEQACLTTHFCGRYVDIPPFHPLRGSFFIQAGRTILALGYKLPICSIMQQVQALVNKFFTLLNTL